MSIQSHLQQQRQTCTFSIQKMSQFLFPQPLYTDLKHAFSTNPVLQSNFNLFNKSRQDLLKFAYSNVPLILNDKDFYKDASIVDAVYQSMQQMPGSIHLSMFLKCIEIMGSEEQKKIFIEDCWVYKVIGCYAQTEIGHGSDIQGLETQATFVQETGEIEIHTPSVSAAKFWPGDLGVMANHAIVFAQLTMKGKKHGVQPFIVKIRDENWQCMPGIIAGDIGPKMSFASKQNGFLMLDHVRVPRTSILSKYVQITPNGQLLKKGDPRIAYATMMFIRQFISTVMPKVYGQAITIAVRYSIFRKQFKSKAGQQLSIISYQTQMEKLIPRIAQYFAITAGGNVIRKLCFENAEKITKGDLSLTPQTHACLCLGKAMYSEVVYDGMEICRKACGGHGFSHYSGLPNLIYQHMPNLTHEGQNTVLYLQVARYVLKNYRSHVMGSGRLAANAEYLASYEYFLGYKSPDYLSQKPQNWRMQDLRKVLAQIVCCLVQKTVTKLSQKQSQYENLSDFEFTSLFVGCNMQQLAKAHAVYFTFVSFLQAVIAQTNEQVRQVLIDLCKLYGIGVVLQYCSPVIERGLIDKEHIAALCEFKEILLNRLRSNVIGIVDALFIPQSRLRSHLAKGNPYENYLQLARKCEVNDPSNTAVHQAVKVVKGIGKAILKHGQGMPKL